MNEKLEVRLLKREEHTLYVDIPLGGESPARPMTGIFIPENYVPQQQVDLILYLHGYKDLLCGPDKSVSIDGYWSSPHWPLREETNRSGKTHSCRPNAWTQIAVRTFDRCQRVRGLCHGRPHRA